MVLAINLQQYTKSSGGTAGAALIAITILAIAAIAIWIWKTKSPAAAAPAADGEETPAPTNGETPAPTTGDFPYAPTGSANDLEDQGQGTRHYASGKADDVTHEWESKTNANSYMIVIDITLTEIDHDDTISFKYGGTHNGSGWYDNSYGFESGQACLGKEEDHPSTDSCEVTGTSIGNLVNQRVMLAGININKGEKLEMWSKMEGGAWQKDVEGGPGVTGFQPNESEDEIQIRIDAAPGIEMHSAAWYEIQGTGTSTGGGEITDEPEGSDSGEEADEDGSAGAVVGYNPELCQSVYFGKCDTECKSGLNTPVCKSCRTVCGVGTTTANVARSFSAVFYRKPSRRAFSSSGTEKENSDVDWDWNSTKLQYSSRRKLRLGNFV